MDPADELLLRAVSGHPDRSTPMLGELVAISEASADARLRALEAEGLVAGWAEPTTWVITTDGLDALP